MSSKRSLMATLAPGILVAATGVGAGDLVNASIAGSDLGLVILWAAWVGAVVKWYLNEGIARWQMATGTTLLEGWTERLGKAIWWFFIPYLILWGIAVGGSLIKACGVAANALFPVNSDPFWSIFVWGVLHSLLGLFLVKRGGFALFEKVMSACIGVMFCAVLFTAAMGGVDIRALAAGLVSMRIPPGGLGWTLAILGGVGGTVTLLSYGYWIAEIGREGEDGLKACRLDLGVGYGMTAIFGMAMVIIGNRVEIDGKGATVAVRLAQQLGELVGPGGYWLFLFGFWAAVFSSLLGVWQSVPYMVADLARMRAKQKLDAIRLEDQPSYQRALWALALVPIPALSLGLKQIQLVYAVLGSLFMPFLAITLLYMNNKKDWVGSFRNGWAANTVLALTLCFFAWQGAEQLLESLAKIISRL